MVGQGKRPLKVFLCHASGDKPAVRGLYKRLVVEGIDAWLDQEKLLPGQTWRLEIPKAVREADVVVICLSNKSITKEGYVQKEIKFALDIADEKPEGTIFLIPARLEDCQVPERLNVWQWVDLFEESGYIKLLQSLRIRADKVGAVIKPLPYDDKELEQRFDQLYTEGLAAFWVEDWDKACHRFQTILSERPNHTGAAEKLEEADRQRNFAKLYSKAVEAQKNQEWQLVISTLEDLLKKTSAYKDADTMLKTARKEQQLKTLYAEAKTLHAAQKWEAVIKVFEQISSIETDYIDPDSLLPSAQREVAELRRLAKLNDTYSDAIRKMDAGQWYEARSLLEQVHKSETGFLETEKLLRKVEDEIERHEEQQKRQNQINTLYEQAHGMLRSKKWRSALDKIEAIRKLDEQFEDPENIAQQVQKELEREEQEAERQNKLAAMYAEAVRLVREEEYQDALETWQDIKSNDSKYPDRQRVQKAAKKGLAALAKPATKKRRITVPQSLWIGLGGIVIVGVIILALNLTGNNDKEPSSPAISVPTSSDGKIVLPIDTFEKTIPWLPLDTNALPTVHFVGFNITHHPFDNALVRQAFVYAIDRQILVDMARGNQENNLRLATTLTPPETLGYDLSGEVGIGFDPQKAKELLSEAGYSAPSDFPTIQIFVYPAGEITSGERFNMASAMADMWQTHLGVTVQVQAMNYDEFTKRLKTNPPDLYWIRWAADYNDPDNFLREIYHSGSQSNFGKFSNAEFDQLVDLAAKSDNPSERQEFYIRAERLLCENEAAVIPVFHTTTP
jgi:outer membrane protein assembly factor BamD (BamD/ComL family)